MKILSKTFNLKDVFFENQILMSYFDRAEGK